MIFDEIRKGARPEDLKNELWARGLKPADFYFTQKNEPGVSIEEPYSPPVRIPAWQIILVLISLAGIVYKIARCRNAL